MLKWFHCPGLNALDHLECFKVWIFMGALTNEANNHWEDTQLKRIVSSTADALRKSYSGIFSESHVLVNAFVLGILRLWQSY